MWLPVNLQQILNNSIPDVRQNIPAYVPQAVSNVPVVLPNVVTNVPNTRAANTSTNTNKQNKSTGMLFPASSLDNISGSVNTVIDDTSGYYSGPDDTSNNVNNFSNIWDYLNIGYTSDQFFTGGKPNWDALAGLLGQGSLSGTPEWIAEIMTQEGNRKWFEETVLPNILNQIKSQYPDFANQIDEFQDFINAGGNVEDWDSGGDTVAKQEAADFGQQILDATSVDQLSDLLSNNPDMKNNPHLSSWIEATGQFPITDDVGIWANLDNIFAECVQGRPCDIESVLDNLGIMFPSIIDLPEWAKILGVGIFKLPSIWEMMQKVGGVFDRISNKIKCEKTDENGNTVDCTATERIVNSLCALKPDAECCVDNTCSPGDLIGGAVGTVVGIGTDALGQIIGKVETLEDTITGAGKYGDILTGNCKKPDGTPKQCSWADLPSEVLDDLIDIFGADSSKWPPWVWAIIGSSVLGGIATKTNLTAEEDECAEKGGTWNGTSCVLPTQTPEDCTSEEYWDAEQETCVGIPDCSSETDEYGNPLVWNAETKQCETTSVECTNPDAQKTESGECVYLCNGEWIPEDQECEVNPNCPETCPDGFSCNPETGECEKDITITECTDPNRDTNPDGSCASGCKSGYSFDGDLCVPDTVTPIEDCSNPEYAAANPEECKNTDPDCAAQNRVTVSTGDRGIGAGETYCGKCINGYIDDGEGNCIPFEYTCSDPNAEVNEDGSCGPCKEGYIQDLTEGSPTHDKCIPTQTDGPGTPSDDDDDDLDLSGGGGGGGQTNFTPFTGGPQWNPAKIGLAALPMSMMGSEGFLQGLMGSSTEGQPQQTDFNQSQKQQSGMLDAQNRFSNAYNQYANRGFNNSGFFNFLNQGRG